MSRPAIIERLAEPLAGGRAVLRETLFADGEQVYSHLSGSPAPADVVRRYEETLTFYDDGRVERRGPSS